MIKAEPGQRQQMRPEDRNELLRWCRHLLGNIDIFVHRYNESMTAYITTGEKRFINYINKERVLVTSAIDEIKLKQQEHPEELDGLVLQAVALFEESIGVGLSLEERMEKYKLESNSLLKTKIRNLLGQRSENAPRYTAEEIERFERKGLHLGQPRMGRD
ncbi:hypothetical protein ACHAPG_005629 [Botrytis cinerea]